MTSPTLDGRHAVARPTPQPIQPANTAPATKPDTPPWRTALLPLAYAATLIAVLLPLSQLWPDSAAPVPVPAPGQPAPARATAAATAAVLAEQLGRKLMRGAECVQSRWQPQQHRAVAACMAAGYGVAQIFVLPAAAGAAAEPLAEDRERMLGWSASERQQRTAGTEPLLHVPAPATDAEPSPGIDQIIAIPGARGGDRLVVRYRWQGLQLLSPGGEPVPGRDLTFGLGAQPESADGSTLAVPVPQAGALALLLRLPPGTAPIRPGPADGDRPTSPASGQPSGHGHWIDAAMPWLSVGALALLALAGLALRLDLRLRARERQYTAELTALNNHLQQQLKENQTLSEQTLQLNRELVEVVYATEQLHTWKNLIGPVVNSLARCRTWLQAPSPPELALQLKSIDNGLASARRLAGDLEHFAIKPGTAEPMGVHALVAQSFTLSQAKAAEANVELVNAVSPQLPPVLIEPGLVKMALSGLIDNAVRAMAAVPTGNAVLMVSARQTDDGRRVRLTLRDHGAGMTEAQRLAMQEGHFGNTGASDGHGTGVARCRVILQRSQGELGEITTSPGGSAIDVVLPVAAQHQETS